MGIIKIVEGVAFVNPKALQVAGLLRLTLEVDDALGVKLISMADLDAVAVAIMDLDHAQTLKTDHLVGIAPLLVGFRDN